MKKEKKLYWKLFISTLQISAFTFGGGFVIIPLLRRKFVTELHWLEEEEMMDFTAIAQSSPGPIAVNASILIGNRIAGLKGALTAILGTVLPPLVIISLISLCYELVKDSPIVDAVLKGMRAAVAAVILDIAVDMGWKVLKSKHIFYILILLLALAATYVLKINAEFIILGAALVSGIFAEIARRRKTK